MGVLLPIGIEYVRLIRDAPSRLWIHARLSATSDHEARTFVIDLEIFDQDGKAVGSVGGFKVRRVKRSTWTTAGSQAKGIGSSKFIGAKCRHPNRSRRKTAVR